MEDKIDLSFPPKQVKICQCKNCFRYRTGSPSSDWVNLNFDNSDFIHYCLSFLPQQQNIQIAKAGIIQSEHASSHSFLLSLDLVNNQGKKRQATVHFIVEDAICDFCESSLSSAQVQQWPSVVVISSYLDRIRPFKWLEKEIENSFQKNEASTINNNSINLFNACSSAEEMIKEDTKLIFRFSSKQMAFRLVSFIKRSLAVKIEEETNKIPRDETDFDIQLTYIITLPAIWTDDLICLPENICKMKSCNSLVICSKVSDSIAFVDPETGITIQITPEIYWKDPFSPLLMKSSMVLFDVLSINLLGPKRGRTQMCDVEIVLDSKNLTESSEILDSKSNKKDAEINNNALEVRSHLGNLLNIGDFCLGYDLRNGISTPFGSGEVHALPEGIIVSAIDANKTIDDKFFFDEFVKDGYNVEMIKKHLLVNKVPPSDQTEEAEQENKELDSNLSSLVI